MDYQIFECSPKARAKIKVEIKDLNDTFISESGLTKYPFSQLKIGQSFTVPIEGAKESSIRLSSTGQGKKQGKKFTVIKHDELGCIEVARIG